MFDTVCSIPLSHELFAQAIHPSEPIVSAGLASGHVYTYRLPGDNDAEAIASESGFGNIETTWKTRRHKGSCRTLGFGIDGSQLYSAGTDSIVKAADVATGQVTAKIRIPNEPFKDQPDFPTLVHALSPQSLILTTDSAALHIYDLRALGPTAAPKPQNTWHPHDDYISSIAPLPPSSASTSGFSKQWVSTGGTTLAVTDIRRGVMVRSEDQGEELLSSVMVTGLSKRGTSVGEKCVVGGSTGVLTLWERGVWDDQDERIVVDRAPGGGESLDSLALFPDGVGPGGKHLAVGLGNGALSFVKIGQNKVVAELQHDEFASEAVVGLGFDVTGRLISGGGKIIKIWHEKVEGEEEEWVDASDSEDEDEKDKNGGATKRQHESSDDDDSEEEESESSDEEPQERKRKRKRKSQKTGAAGNGILGFSGLD